MMTQALEFAGTAAQIIPFEFHKKWKDPATNRWNKHVYLWNGKRMTGVTTVLGIIAKPALIQWAADMACEYVDQARQSEKFTIDDLGEILKEARVAHAQKRDNAGDRGTDVHALVENYIKASIQNNGEALVESDGEDKMLNAFRKWAVDNQVRFLESEKKIYSSEWFVAGTADFTCIINGKRYVGDLKTMKKMWDRTPHFQTAAYMKMLVEMGEEKYDGTVIVNINKDTNELTEYYSYDFEADIKSFEAALTLYRTINL